MINLRRRPIGLAIVAAVVVLLFLWHMNYIDHEYVSTLPGKFTGGSSKGSSSSSSTPPPSTSSEVEFDFPIMKYPSLEYLDKPLTDAHKLKDADDFLPHFNALAGEYPLTMAQVQSTCTWNTTAEKVNFQYGADTDWVVNERTTEELWERRGDLHDYVRDMMIPWGMHKHRFHGRGIVTLGGNEEGKTFKRMIVAFNALKRVGSKLPIEVHYWADEFSAENRKLIHDAFPDVTFHDLASAENIVKVRKTVVANFQFKIAAVLNSKFAEPLLLDSDNLAMINPEELYESETYKEYGSLFWPDIARTRKQNPMWAITNTYCRMDEYEQESGQLVVDKRKFWYHLQLALWFINSPRQRFYYSNIILGDKDTFRFAWHALRTQYGYPAKWLSSVGTYRDDKSYCGHSFAQYHPDKKDGRVAFLHGGLLKSFSKHYVHWLKNTGQGIFQVYKKSPVEFDHSKNPTEIMIGVLGNDGYVAEEPKDKLLARCTWFLDIEPRPVEELIPGVDLNQMFEEIQGYWIMDES